MLDLNLSRICFATPLARPLLDASFHGDHGGAEVRAVTFATGLAALSDFEVSMALISYGSEPTRAIQGITAYFHRHPTPIPRVRDLPRDRGYYWNVVLTNGRKLQRSLRKKRDQYVRVRPRAQPFYCRLHADILCVFGVHHFASHVIKSAQDSGKRSILFLASDTDLDGRFLESGTARNCHGQQADMCLFAIQNADQIVAQTNEQQTTLKRRFGRDSTVIKNPIPADISPGQSCGPRKRDYVLWVGRADTYSKRADKCFELARKCPEIPFITILNKRDDSVFLDLVRQAPPNVEIVEKVPYTEIDGYFRDAQALINTSDAEGFPNTFLQAGKHGVPIFSLTVNPNDMFTTHGCGRLARGDLDLMALELSHYWSQRHEAAGMSTAIAEYVQLHHGPKERVLELAEVIAAMSRTNTDRKTA